MFAVQPPQPTALPAPTPTAGPVVCNIVGAIKLPGVYTLSPHAVVQDAIQAAGGPTIDADLERLNLAASIHDHQHIVVPRRQIESSPGVSAGENVSGAEMVNINTASSEILQTLPGIGPVLASRIIDYREEIGPFNHLDELVAVKGIGKVTLDRLRPLITVGP